MTNQVQQHPETVLTKLVSGKVVLAEDKNNLNGQTVEFFFNQIDWPSEGGMDNCISVNGFGCLLWIDYSSMKLLE